MDYICDKHSNHCGARSRQTDEMRRWVSDYLLARSRASVSEVHVEFRKSGFDLSRTTLHRIMCSQHRPVRPIRTHKVRLVNCKRRVDFCIDMLSRLHRFDQLQGVHRRIPVKLRRVPDHMALDPARLCFQEVLLRRDLQAAWTRLKAGVDMDKLLANWRPPLGRTSRVTGSFDVASVTLSIFTVSRFIFFVSRSIFSVLVNTFKSPHIRVLRQNSHLFCADIRCSSKCAQGMCTMDCECPQILHQDRQKQEFEQ